MPSPRSRTWLLLLLAAALLLLTWTAERRQDRAERAAHQTLLIRAEAENARLRAALTALTRRPERALALAVESDLEIGLLGLINADRAALGRQALAADRQLEWVARYRANSLAASRYYAHVSPTGESATSILQAFGGPNAGGAGENLWQCQSWQTCDSTQIHGVFVASEGHRLNQERSEWTHFGYGGALNLDGNYLLVELFSTQETVEALARRGG